MQLLLTILWSCRLQSLGWLQLKLVQIPHAPDERGMGSRDSRQRHGDRDRSNNIPFWQCLAPGAHAWHADATGWAVGRIQSGHGPDARRVLRFVTPVAALPPRGHDRPAVSRLAASPRRARGRAVLRQPCGQTTPVGRKCCPTKQSIVLGLWWPSRRPSPSPGTQHAGVCVSVS